METVTKTKSTTKTKLLIATALLLAAGALAFAIIPSFRTARGEDVQAP